MPEKKTGWAQLRVGVMAIAAMVILAVLVFLITGNTNIFASRSYLYTYLSDAASLTNGAPVNLNGIPVGKVKEIKLSGLGVQDPQKTVKITMEIDTSRLRDIPVDSLTSISAANVLGTKFINIKMGKATVHVENHSTLPSLNTAEFEDVVQQGYAILTPLQGTVERIDRIVGLIESGKGSIGKLLVDETLYNNVMRIVSSVQQLADALNSDKGTIGKLIYDPELYNQVRGELARVDDLMQGLQRGEGTAGKCERPRALRRHPQKRRRDQLLLADLNAGKRTAGKLLKSDELAKQLQGTIGRLDQILDKVNSGQGTIGQLLVNTSLYDNLNGTSREMHELMKDFRANPKKFLRIKLSLF